ncbi:MAG: DUF1003 domain-containing protein [Myxococcales bacterium]|nr:DUF1003 domain-containing protein [Myxococcales bacterium]
MQPSFICPTCGKSRSSSQRVAAERLLDKIRSRIQANLPGWDGQVTCRTCLRHYRVLVLREAMERQRGSIDDLDASILARMEQNQLLARNLAQPPPRLGARVADAVATFGGSWLFLGLFGGVLAVWMMVNVLLLSRPFDPYPFILLNLVLSCLAAVQAPVILMSQNRQATRDRARAEHDYEINLKAELEVRLLHEKVDHLVLDEWQNLLEAQAVQTEMLDELLERVSDDEAH